MSNADVNDELTEEVRRRLQQHDERFRHLIEWQECLNEIEAREQAFARDFGVYKIKWSRHNLMRLLNKTGEPPERILELRELLDRSGMKAESSRYINCGGVWDHGEMWAKNGQPWIVVGDPYNINDEEQAALDQITRWSPRLLLSIDDRESYYCPETTHHVRLELV